MFVRFDIYFAAVEIRPGKLNIEGVLGVHFLSVQKMSCSDIDSQIISNTVPHSPKETRLLRYLYDYIQFSPNYVPRHNLAET